MSWKGNSAISCFILFLGSLLSVSCEREFEISHDNNLLLTEPYKAVSVNDSWSIDLSTNQEDDIDSVPIVKFQLDSIVSTDTIAELNGTLPDLNAYSLCLWLMPYYRRISSAIVSYALNSELDNYLLISQAKDYLEVSRGDYYLEFANHGYKTSAFKWMHICLVESMTSLALYIDGNEAIPTVRNERQNKKVSLVATLQGGGTLVIGQDQDTVGGGYQLDNALSGAIADFQLFSTAITHQDVQTMFMCQKMAKTPLLDLTDKRWEFKNVLVSKIRKSSLCYIKQKNTFNFFKKRTNLLSATQDCQKLGGSLPHNRNVKDMLRTVKGYLEYWQEIYGKFHVHLSITEESTCSDLEIRWQRNTFIKAAMNDLYCTQTLSHFVCEFETKAYITMSGIPQSIEDDTDSLYHLERFNGNNVLQGIQKSIIEYGKGSWCLHHLGNAKLDVTLCCPSETDYPPIGRKLWTQTSKNTTSLIALTSCSEHQFTCDSGDCIHLSRRCDTHNNCSDKSDERGCSYVYNSEEQNDSITRGPQEPLVINGSVTFLDIPKINLDENNFLTSIWINITWKDPRVSFLNLAKETETFMPEGIEGLVWVPAFALKPVHNAVNRLSSVTSVKQICDGERKIKNTMEENVFSYKCTEIWVRQFYHVTWQCVFNLEKFPFETVECLLNIGLELQQLWSEDVRIFLPNLEHLPYEVTLTSQFISGSVLSVKLLFQRKSGGYITTTFIPIVILLIITLLTFFFEEQDFTNRVMVTVSVLIVVASLFAQQASNLPNTSYTKCIDVVFLCTIFFLSLVFGCHVLLAVIRRQKKNNALVQQQILVRDAKVEPTKNALGGCVPQLDRNEVYKQNYFYLIITSNLLVYCICGTGAILAIAFSVNNCT